MTFVASYGRQGGAGGARTEPVDDGDDREDAGLREG